MSTSPDYRPDLDGILDGVYACKRWQVGTMTDQNFVPAGETEIRSDLQTWRDRAIADELRSLTTLRQFRDLQDVLNARADELDGDTEIEEQQ